MADVVVQQDGPAAWRRLAVALLLATVGGVGLWSSVVVLPVIEVEFGIDRGGASVPYTATMIGFAMGGILIGRLADRLGIMIPVMIGAVVLGLGYIAASQAGSYWAFVATRECEDASENVGYFAGWQLMTSFFSNSRGASTIPIRAPMTLTS